MPERVDFLLGLSEAPNAPGQRTTVTFVLPGCLGVITELPSLNCSNCYVNMTRFDVFVAHFVVVVRRELTCFGAGRVLVRDFGYCNQLSSVTVSWTTKQQTAGPGVTVEFAAERVVVSVEWIVDCPVVVKAVVELSLGVELKLDWRVSVSVA